MPESILTFIQAALLCLPSTPDLTLPLERQRIFICNLQVSETPLPFLPGKRKVIKTSSPFATLLVDHPTPRWDVCASEGFVRLDLHSLGLYLVSIFGWLIPLPGGRMRLFPLQGLELH